MHLLICFFFTEWKQHYKSLIVTELGVFPCDHFALLVYLIWGNSLQIFLDSICLPDQESLALKIRLHHSKGANGQIYESYRSRCVKRKCVSIHNAKRLNEK